MKFSDREKKTLKYLIQIEEYHHLWNKKKIHNSKLWRLLSIHQDTFFM